MTFFRGYIPSEKRAATQRTPQIPCRFCPAVVDQDVVMAARHLIHACKRATPAAKDAAHKVLADLRRQEEQRQAEQMRAGGVPEEQIESALHRLRAQDYELTGPPPELKHDRANGISSKVIDRMAARLERVK